MMLSLLTGGCAWRGLNLTLREIVCYKFSFRTCAAAATVRQRFSAARAFLTLGGFQKRNG